MILKRENRHNEENLYYGTWGKLIPGLHSSKTVATVSTEMLVIVDRAWLILLVLFRDYMAHGNVYDLHIDKCGLQ